jgi:hypothetical protein
LGPGVPSSHDSHVLQGVRPPAQLQYVPASDGKLDSSRPARVSKTEVVVPPVAFES